MGPTWFCEQRQRLGLSIEDVAHKAGVNKSTWSRWEAGHQKPGIKRTISLLQAFEDMDYSWLLSRRLRKNEETKTTARALGIAEPLYRRWEAKRAKPRTLAQLLKIAAWSGDHFDDVQKEFA
jgi:transcriptional regulator with XRE-family HTH domain